MGGVTALTCINIRIPSWRPRGGAKVCLSSSYTARPFGLEDLEMIRQHIEECFDNIAEVDDEIRHRPHVNSISPSTSNLRSKPLTVTTALVGNVVSLVLILRDRP